MSAQPELKRAVVIGHTNGTAGAESQVGVFEVPKMATLLVTAGGNLLLTGEWGKGYRRLFNGIPTPIFQHPLAFRSPEDAEKLIPQQDTAVLILEDGRIFEHENRVGEALKYTEDRPFNFETFWGS